MPLQPETQLQIEVAKILDDLGLLWFHCPNGGKRNANEARLLKAMGVKSGVPDVMILTYAPNSLSRKGAFIELKAGKNKQTPAQIEWQDKLLKAGWVGGVARSVNEVHVLLKRWGYYEYRRATPLPIDKTERMTAEEYRKMVDEQK